jgi:hypothetical protein
VYFLELIGCRASGEMGLVVYILVAGLGVGSESARADLLSARFPVQN